MVEAVQALYGDEQPAFRARDRAHALELRFRGLGVAVTSDERAHRRAAGRRFDQIPAMYRRRDRSLDHQAL